MWAMMPRLRILLRSGVAMTPPKDHHKDAKSTKEQDKEGERRGLVSLSLAFALLLCALCAFVVNPRPALPREVGEGLVGLGHLDGVLALGHGLALAAVGGHQLVGQAQEHRPARLAPGGADDPADRQALLAGL